MDKVQKRGFIKINYIKRNSRLTPHETLYVYAHTIDIIGLGVAVVLLVLERVSACTCVVGYEITMRASSLIE
jgi:hypothetical protein